MGAAIERSGGAHSPQVEPDGQGVHGVAPRADGARKAAAVEYPRCTHCRNPIKSHQRQIRHPLTELSFHDDCWAEARDAVQQEYVQRIREQGLAAMISPYVVQLGDEPWLPVQRDEDAEVPAEPVKG